MSQRKKEIITYEVIAVAIMVLMAFLLRYQGFKNGTRTTFDEALYAYMAYEMSYDIHHYNAINYSMQHAKRRKKKLPDYLYKKIFKHPPMYCYLVLLSYKIHKTFGMDARQHEWKEFLRQAVIVSVTNGALTIFLIYLLGRIIFGGYVGVLAALFLFLDPVHWICSQKIWMETTITFFMTGAPLLYLYSYRKKDGDFVFYILAGIASGCAALTKYPGGLIFFAILFYTLLTRPKLIASPKWMLLPFSMFMVLIHWLLWNLDVYGFDFISATGRGFEDMQSGYVVLKKMIPLFILFIVIGTGIFLFFKKHRTEIPFSVPKILLNKYFWMAMMWLFIIIGIGSSWGEIIPALSLTYEPPTSWRMGFFKNEPWYFYLKKLFEYFPVYIFAYCAPFFMRWKEREHKILPVICSVLIFLFFIFWGNFQSRYILPVVPWMLLLSAYSIFFIHDKITAITNVRNRKVFLAVLWSIVIFGIIKAIEIDILLAWTNKPCYF